MMIFEQFAGTVRAAGLIARRCTSDHWQIIGGVKPVNVYPYSKRGFSFYVSGAVRGTRGKAATIENAIKAARDGECTPQAKVGRKHGRWNRREKERLFARDPHCRWCRVPLTREMARMDHIVPLDQGGSNRRDNLCLACVDCDLNKRGNKAIKPKIDVNAAAADAGLRVDGDGGICMNSEVQNACAPPGTDIDTACRRLLEHARRTGEMAQIDFNGIVLEARPDDDPSAAVLVSRYYALLQERQRQREAKDVLKIAKANCDHTPVADFAILSDGEPPEITGVRDWEQNFRRYYADQGGRLGAFLVAHLPGGTIDQLLVYLLNHRAEKASNGDG